MKHRHQLSTPSEARSRRYLYCPDVILQQTLRRLLSVAAARTEEDPLLCEYLLVLLQQGRITLLRHIISLSQLLRYPSLCFFFQPLGILYTVLTVPVRLTLLLLSRVIVACSYIQVTIHKSGERKEWKRVEKTV
jgi:hypothetical protein